MNIGLVVPHIFMHEGILPGVIFSPGHLALDLAAGLERLGARVTLFTPGPVPVDRGVRNITADLSYFERELAGRGDTYIDLLKKHPLTFITLARQVQSELVAAAYAAAGRGELDVVHVYTNEEDIALPFAQFCARPVVFTHHDPFNFMVKYKNVFPKYAYLNWISMSLAQRAGMPVATNWVGNIYHGLDPARFSLVREKAGGVDEYIAYLGRVVQPKGVHLAIAAARQAGLKLKIAGKHYAGHKKDAYWQERVEPELGMGVEYVGFLRSDAEKQEFLGNARALIVPSLFEEPFGMVMIEALACGTPVVGLDSGAIGEVVKNGETGFVVRRSLNEAEMAVRLAEALERVGEIDRAACRRDFEARFTLERMAREHLHVYETMTESGAPETTVSRVPHRRKG